jgi:hypothetical protein
MAMQQGTQNPQGAAGGEEKKDEDDDNNLNMSQSMLDFTQEMCGLPISAHINLLPAWYQLCAAKGTSHTYKKIIIQKLISHV